MSLCFVISPVFSVEYLAWSNGAQISAEQMDPISGPPRHTWWNHLYKKIIGKARAQIYQQHS